MYIKDYVDAAESPDARDASGSKELSGVCVIFPETWLWSESSTGCRLMSALVLVFVVDCGQCVVAAADSMQCMLMFCACVSVLLCVKDYWRRKVALSAASPEMAYAGSPPGSREPLPKEPSRVRVEFPETWLWSDSVTGYI